MRVLHCCLACFYVDDYSYQENILPRMHQLQGHEVEIVASTETFRENCRLGYVAPRRYRNRDGIPVARLPYVRWMPHFLARKIRLYRGLEAELERFQPEIIFLHDCQFLGIRSIVRYARQKPQVIIYVDGHTDFINSAQGWLSERLLHGVLYRYCAQIIAPFTRKFYGVLPARVSFFTEMYGIPPERVSLLVMGAEDIKVSQAGREEVRRRIRTELGLSERDFVLASGGKLDARKNMVALLKAVRDAKDPELRLVIFGSLDPLVASEIKALVNHDRIHYVGWVDSDQVYEYLLAADLAVFPGTHSVLWEQAAGVGLPCVFRKWIGMQHVDVGGNCLFLETGSREEIAHILSRIRTEAGLFERMRTVARQKGIPEFSYSAIARRSIES
jgi:glycosyltransferase involved in cell wall biosynthesis